MFNIGDTVTYIRHHADGSFTEGEGKVKGMGLDGANHSVALVQEGENAFNTPLPCLNATEEFKAQYKTMVTEVLALSQEGNEKSREIVQEYNKKIIALENSVLGEPIILYVPPVPQDNTEEKQAA